tara:strand:- start:1518 stop:1661 length:144 start_codon:yes stop_codon:yes gene_type:complete
MKKTFIRLENEPNVPELSEKEMLEKSIDVNSIDTNVPNFDNLELDDN